MDDVGISIGRTSARSSSGMGRTPAARDAVRPDGANAPNGGALIRRAYDALVTAGAPLPLAALVREVFGATVPASATGGPWLALLDPLLRRSPLFSPSADGSWRLAEWEVARLKLADMEWAVLDVETTGLAPGRHRVIEAAVVLVRGGELREKYSRLVNPERRIPEFITSFTGITQHMVDRSRRTADVLPELREFIGQRVIVGHNIGFDLGFLAYESARLGSELGFPDDGIDTIALARRYLTGMRRVRLDRLAATLHVPVATRHRALADARVTAHCFVLLLARAMQEGCETLDDLRAALDGHDTAHADLPPARPTGGMYLNPAWRQTFPSKPGVYLMKDDRGEVIYVGKAKCLKDRLASYYSQPLGYTRKMDGLLQSVREIETRVLGSELEALLVESRLIKQLQPRYNVQLRNYEHYPFIKVDVAHAFPRVYATREVAADGARYFGPFRSGRIVDATIELLHRVFPVRTCTRALPPDAPASEPCLRYHLKRCPAPCRGTPDQRDLVAYQTAVEDMCAFLGGERDDLIDRLRRQMLAAAAQQDFERAARLRDALRDADQVLLGQRLVTGAVDANNLLIAYPSADEGHAELFLVRHGRLIDQRRVPADQPPLAAALTEQLALARALGTPPDRVGKAEVDQINIIARWIHHHSDEETRSFFHLPRDLADAPAAARFVEEVSAAIPRALSAPLVPPGADAFEPADADADPDAGEDQDNDA